MRFAVLPERRHGVLELVFGPRFVARPVLAGVILGQPRAQAGPQNRHHHVRRARPGDLVLEGGRGGQRLVLPEDRFEHDAAGVLALQALYRALRERTFFVHVTR